MLKEASVRNLNASCEGLLENGVKGKQLAGMGVKTVVVGWGDDCNVGGSVKHKWQT